MRWTSPPAILRGPLLAAATFALIACDGPTGPDPGHVAAGPAADPLPEPTAPTPPTAPAVAPSPLGDRLIVHEWGTWTSLQASDGAPMDGLHHEEEALPEFVVRRCSGCTGDKGFEQLPGPVTQKLETPVLYFYSDAARDVRVDVTFPDGIISEYYPAPTAYAPPLFEAVRLGDGETRWEVRVDPSLDPAGFPAVAEDDIWAPSRRTAAASIVSQGESERFIFYRGLGDFDLPVAVNAEGDGVVTVALAGDDALPAAFVLDVGDDRGAVVATGPLAGGARVAIPLTEREPLEAFVARAKALVREALVADGLYTDEAQAMVDTWDHSYFRTPGLRVLYLASRAWTDALLPIAITPTPDALVRTMVGRIEVSTAADEQALLARVVDARAEAGDDVDTCVTALYARHGRLLEARLRAAERHNTDADLGPFIARLIKHASGPFFGLAPPPSR